MKIVERKKKTPFGGREVESPLRIIKSICKIAYNSFELALSVPLIHHIYCIIKPIKRRTDDNTNNQHLEESKRNAFLIQTRFMKSDNLNCSNLKGVEMWRDILSATSLLDKWPLLLTDLATFSFMITPCLFELSHSTAYNQPSRAHYIDHTDEMSRAQACMTVSRINPIPNTNLCFYKWWLKCFLRTYISEERKRDPALQIFF